MPEENCSRATQVGKKHVLNPKDCVYLKGEIQYIPKKKTV